MFAFNSDSNHHVVVLSCDFILVNFILTNV